MVRDKNAIEVLAVQVTFAEPLNNFLTRRVKDDVESPARKAGYTEAVPLQGFRVTVGQGVSPGVVPIQGTATSLQKTGVVRDSLGNVQNVVKGKVDITPTELVFQTYEYESWTKTEENILSILTPGVRRAMQGAALGAIRFEYLDRFIFDGEKSHSSPEGVLSSSSKWLTPHIFSDPSLWHSHTGLFDEVRTNRRTLIGVNADLQEIDGGPDHPDFGKRSVQLVTFSEYQFLNGGGEIPSEEVEKLLSSYLDDLYSIARRAFSEVIDPKFAKANGLPSCES